MERWVRETWHMGSFNEYLRLDGNSTRADSMHVLSRCAVLMQYMQQ